jgi:uncharacterized lipoprotein YmbA
MVPQNTPSTILVTEVTLSEHLTRKDILSRDRHYEVSAAPFDRWAESLESNITSVLAENLAVLSPSDKVISHPWTFGDRADFTVSVQVLAFGPDPSGDVTLNAIWRIVDAGGSTLELQRASYSQPRATDDVVATVAAMSVVLGEMSFDIASSLRASSTASARQPD